MEITAPEVGEVSAQAWNDIENYKFTQNPLVELYKRDYFLSDKNFFDFTRTFDFPTTCMHHLT